MASFLQLPPEMGGFRFGPFNAQITIGSDSKRNLITVDPAHGVYPQHAVISPAAAGSYILEPRGAECKIFMTPSGQAQVWPVSGPVQMNPGDVLIVGTPHGPRFLLQTDRPQAAAPTSQAVIQQAAARGEAGLIDGVSAKLDNILGPTAPSGSALGREMKRQSQARILSQPGPIRDAYQVWTRYRTGAWNNPVTLVGVLVAFVGLVGTGSVVSCSGVIYTMRGALGLGM